MTEKEVTENVQGIPEEEVTYTVDDMKRDTDFYMAERMTKILLEDGRITEEEYEKIMAEHARNFSPTLAPLMVENR